VIGWHNLSKESQEVYGTNTVSRRLVFDDIALSVGSKTIVITGMTSVKGSAYLPSVTSWWIQNE